MKRNIILWGVALLVLLVVNGLAFQKERLTATGQPIFLELAPVDPRSLIQGDYMRLRYAISRQAQTNSGPLNGFIVIRLDKNNVAQYVRLYDSQTTLAENERLLYYRQRDSEAWIGPESFLFQEGHAEYYENAKYAELRLSEAGDVVLVGLRGEDIEKLGPP